MPRQVTSLVVVSTFINTTQLKVNGIIQTLYPSDITSLASCDYAVSIFKNAIIVGCVGINKAYIYKLNDTNKTNETWYQLSTLTEHLNSCRM